MGFENRKSSFFYHFTMHPIERGDVVLKIEYLLPQNWIVPSAMKSLPRRPSSEHF